jgi:hypothetical protein
MGLDEIETTEMPSRSQTAGIPSRPVQGYGSRVEHAAHRLRARGYSYRRISRELSVRYDLVTLWLSGESEVTPSVYLDGRIEPSFAAPRPALPVAATARPQPDAAAWPSAVPAADVSEWRRVAAALEQRVKDLLASLVQLSQESREREARLSQAAEDDRAAARAREERYFDEMQSLRGAVSDLEQRLGQAPSALVADARPVRRFFWQRGRPE